MFWVLKRTVSLRPFISLLVKPRLFSGFLRKKYNFMHLKGEMPLKMHKIIFVPPPPPPQKKEKYVCLPYLRFSDLLPETRLFVIWP